MAFSRFFLHSPTSYRSLPRFPSLLPSPLRPFASITPVSVHASSPTATVTAVATTATTAATTATAAVAAAAEATTARLIPPRASSRPFSTIGLSSCRLSARPFARPSPRPLSKHFSTATPVAMRVIPVPALEDNYSYIILDEKSSEAAVVDPVEPQKLMHILQHLGAKLTSVLCTHHHWDHAGGNVELITKKPGLAVFGADARIPEINYVVKDKEEFKLGSLTIQALWTHCHTKGSVSYYVRDGTDRAVFTGDTLFLSGCGRFFEGTAADMYNSLLHILATLPVETKVYCGHEYTKANLQFALHVEPSNSHVQQKLQWIVNDSVAITVPGTIGEELLCNPFLRVNEPTLQEFTGRSDPIDVMHVLRELKNNFKA